MRLYNTLTRQLEEFVPPRDGTVRMYTCGLTVYARGHIGNFRTFVCVDVLRRALKYVAGYKMHHVMNFTDVDDKTIVGAAKAGLPLREYTDQYIKAFREDAAALGIEPVEDTPRATDPENLDGDGRDDQRARRSAATPTPATDRSTSRSRRCRRTASWRAWIMKASNPARASTRTSTTRRARATSCCGRRPSRTSRRGTSAAGRAGRGGTSSARRWRCACSASRRSTFIPAASTWCSRITRTRSPKAKARPGKEFSRFWFHVEHLLVDNQKMSKSVGNVYTVQDVLDKGFRLSALRYILLSGLLPQAAELHLDRASSRPKKRCAASRISSAGSRR